jgi:excisionase family DNA binding protein
VSDRLLTSKEIAELLGVKPSWVQAKTRSEEIPYVPLGRYRRYVEDDVRAWLESLKSGGYSRPAK